jgi:hypothetical protein
MKNLALILVFLTATLSAQTECPPVAWCHPDGEGLGWPYTSLLGGMTEAADAVGKVMNDDGCAGANYAEMLYCYPAKWIADAIPCMYGKDTPQATLCDEGGDGGGDGDGGEAENQSYSANPNFTPFYTTEPKAKQVIQKFLAKKSRGQVITKLDKGYVVKLKSKFFTNKNKTEYVAMMELFNPKGQVVGRPILFTKGKRVYVHDLLPKKGKNR